VKIMHVTKKYPDALGGDAVVVSSLEKQQKLNGHKVIIYTSNCGEIRSGKNIYKFGLKDAPASLDNITPKRVASLIMLFFKSFKVLRNERPDIIHTHSIDMAFFVSFAARHFKIPIVHTFHIVTFYDDTQSSIRRKTELLLARGSRISKITALNRYDVKKLQEAGLKQATLLHNGIDLEFWGRKQRIKKTSIFTFITVGRLEEQKGIEYLIGATAILRDKINKKFRVLIIGEGLLKVQLEGLVKSQKLEDYIKFMGRKDSDEIRKAYESSHVAVFPSLYEAMSLSLLEAWATQIPVIATPVGLLRDSDDKSASLFLD